MTGDLIVGADGLARCSWGAEPADYRAYHDDEWGHAVTGDAALFERLTLEAFQSGLSWLTILRKREGFRAAFEGFDLDTIASFDDHDVERLMADPSIVRNRRKIEATITNAQATIALVEREGAGALERLVASYAPAPRGSRPQRLSDLTSSTPESTALSKDLKKRGFVFVGPTTMYSTMQAIGLVDDHLKGCHRAP